MGHGGPQPRCVGAPTKREHPACRIEPEAHRSPIWLTVWSSLVHGAIMAVQAVVDPAERGHLPGDVAALFLVAAGVEEPENHDAGAELSGAFRAPGGAPARASFRSRARPRAARALQSSTRV